MKLFNAASAGRNGRRARRIFQLRLWYRCLETYWPRFEGLRDHLAGYQSQIAARLGGYSAEVLDVGLVDSPAKAREAASTLGTANLVIVFLYVSTYALSSTVLPVVQRLSVPVIV